MAMIYNGDRFYDGFSYIAGVSNVRVMASKGTMECFLRGP